MVWWAPRSSIPRPEKEQTPVDRVWRSTSRVSLAERRAGGFTSVSPRVHRQARAVAEDGEQTRQRIVVPHKEGKDKCGDKQPSGLRLLTRARRPSDCPAQSREI